LQEDQNQDSFLVRQSDESTTNISLNHTSLACQYSIGGALLSSFGVSTMIDSVVVIRDDTLQQKTEGKNVSWSCGRKAGQIYHNRHRVLTTKIQELLECVWNNLKTGAD
jgi:hypothetical protein